MRKLFFPAAFLLGAAAIAWMGASFIGINTLALAVITVIGGVYIFGYAEMFYFRSATETLRQALMTLPGTKTDPKTSTKEVELYQWINLLHPSLQNAVRTRIEGERVGLPAPIVTPYLVGLLVVLGLLGTFLGMVATLQGAATALEGTTELQAIREGLAAPIKGLALAFGTSVAGVAASVSLGLVATMSRRERMLATRQLDTKANTVFQHHTLSFHRQETFKALQLQASALPEMVTSLKAVSEQMTHMSEQLNQQLTSRQQDFHTNATQSYRELAASVENSLKTSLSDSAKLAAEAIEPVMTSLMEAVSVQAEQTHKHLSDTTEKQLNTLSERFSNTSDEVSTAWQQGIQRQQSDNTQLLESVQNSFNSSLKAATEQVTQSAQASSANMLEQIATLLTASEALVQTRINNENTWLHTQETRMQTLTETLKTELKSLRDDEAGRAESALSRLEALETHVADHLSRLGKALEAPMSTMISTAFEAPRAATELMTQLRGELSKTLERDNALLLEREQINQGFKQASDALSESALGQKIAIENLVSTSDQTLKTLSNQFAQQLDIQLAQVSDAGEHFSCSAVEMASLGEAFSLAIKLFSESNQQLIDKLEHIEQALSQSTARSDEQLGYYVAQAREIIDHSVMSQKEIFEEVRQLSEQATNTDESNS